MAILELKNVNYSYHTRYHTVDVLKDVCGTFEQGKLYALVGKSGSGKSTLLSLLAGLMLPQSGEVLFEGTPTAKMNLDRYRLYHAAVIYQSFRLFPLLTVSENITYPMELRGCRGEKARQRAAALVEKVNLPANVLDRFPDMLSGGEQQRVAVSRAMSMNSGLLLADEPTGNLDTENGNHLISILLDLAHNDHYCVIVVTHDLDLAARADQTLRMCDGMLQDS
ncbi:MAG TPA: ABC transporter ATP-binding protein [Candidatus Limiplasma sp.]|nr:ABC transporter ATP-binding protein [Candidatus Limiplasma sp.]